MQKLDKFAHAAKVVALCLPPVATALIGLAVMSRSRKKEAVAALADKRPASAPRRPRLRARG